jgi:uncharacterized protein (TIGR03435 family)
MHSIFCLDTRRLLFAIAMLTLAALSAPAQASAAPSPTRATSSAPTNANAATEPAFDVVTIKRNKTGLGPATIDSPSNGDSVTITNMSPHLLIGFAFELALHDTIYGLPAWTDSETYDITAKVAESGLPAFHRLLPRQRNPMLQPLLEDRFHLKSHYENKELPAYALVVAKGGSKLIAVEPAITPDGGRDPGGIRMGRGEITANAAPIAVLLDGLSQQLGRPVVDRTGLAGHYNFTLQFTPAQASTDSQTDAGPSIFTAVQEQLGLKLESTKGAVPVLVIDHIERPTEN